MKYIEHVDSCLDKTKLQMIKYTFYDNRTLICVISLFSWIRNHLNNQFDMTHVMISRNLGVCWTCLLVVAPSTFIHGKKTWFVSDSGCSQAAFCQTWRLQQDSQRRNMMVGQAVTCFQRRKVPLYLQKWLPLLTPLTCVAHMYMALLHLSLPFFFFFLNRCWPKYAIISCAWMVFNTCK